ncbi:sugar phosphate isomerase/epimerase family protein [Aestuariimicrobium ganziense]|uniref:sugar phosphate isomerase/epimerase family protein n=1 Tax=Aestuariimicrobium ganziense TaxID=2773677 RepID=UPI0019414688|nr:sugar phosphate isomerase/epimerase [Aestuariimicrobium ganziense]
MSNLSLQLYTVRDELVRDADAALATIAATGITEVEPFGITNFREWLPEALKRHGLRVTSTHTDLLGDFEGSVAALKELDGKLLIQPFFDPAKWLVKEGVEELAGLLNEAAKKAAAEGLEVGYHNHHFEFFGNFDGVNSYDYFASLLDPEVKLEIDTYWVAIAGLDPVEVINRYGDRVTHLHIKDGPVEVQSEFDMDKLMGAPANVVLGKGDIDLPTLLGATGDKTWVVEFDKSDGDVLTDVVDSITYLQNR